MNFSEKFEEVHAYYYVIVIINLDKVTPWQHNSLYDFITIWFHWKTLNNNIELLPSPTLNGKSLQKGTQLTCATNVSNRAYNEFLVYKLTKKL